MRYLLIETSQSSHEVSLLVIMKILKSKENIVDIFATGKNLRRVYELNLNNSCQIFTGNLFDLICLTRKYNYIIYNTTSARGAVQNFILSILNVGKNIYYIRNANSWIKFPKFRPEFKYFPIRLIIYFLKFSMLKMKKSIIVEKGTIKNYLYNHKLDKIDVIPFNIKQDDIRTQKDIAPILKIVVPGIVDFSRKDIEIILKILEQCLELNMPFKLVLLGKQKSIFEKEICQNYKIKCLSNLVLFDDFIPENEFNMQMASADVVLGLFKIVHEDKYLNERYGLTRGSGVDAHAYSNSKPLIVDTNYDVDDEYKNATIFFESYGDLFSIILRLIVDKDYLANQKLIAEQCAEKYSLVSVINAIKYLW